MDDLAISAGMSCEALVELVTAYVDGALTPADARALEAHRDECEGCGAYLDQFRQTIHALGELREGGVDPDERVRLLAMFQDARGYGRAGRAG